MVRVLVLQHAACEGLGGFEPFFDKQGIAHDHVALYAGEKAPADLSRYRGIIILGGPMNVYQEDEYPFLVYENGLIKDALATLKPMLGICLGAQLIAKASGSRVVTGHRKEVGWCDVKLTRDGCDDLLLKGFPRSFKAFEWHGDTFDIPNKGIKLASTEIFPNQAFRVGNAYGLQFHLEVTERMAVDLTREYAREIRHLDYIDEEEILRDNKKHSKNATKLADRLYENFLNFISR